MDSKKTIDQRAEDYADSVELSKLTYRGDVVTAYVVGAMDEAKISQSKIASLEHEKLEFIEIRNRMWAEIRKLEAKEWISVKDRLPTDGEIVVIDWPDNPHFPFVARFRKNHEKQFIIPLRSDVGVEDVTHWLPLHKLP